MTCNREKLRDHQVMQKSYSDSLKQSQQLIHDSLFENRALDISEEVLKNSKVSTKPTNKPSNTK